MSDQPERDLAIISRHEKGFWQGDLYRGAADFCDAGEMEAMGLSPDAFFTLTGSASQEDAQREAEEFWPGAKIVVADDEEEPDDV